VRGSLGTGSTGSVGADSTGGSGDGAAHGQLRAILAGQAAGCPTYPVVYGRGGLLSLPRLGQLPVMRDGRRAAFRLPQRRPADVRMAVWQLLTEREAETAVAVLEAMNTDDWTQPARLAAAAMRHVGGLSVREVAESSTTRATPCGPT
jgi:hypothetical protein